MVIKDLSIAKTVFLLLIDSLSNILGMGGTRLLTEPEFSNVSYLLGPEFWPRLEFRFLIWFWLAENTLRTQSFLLTKLILLRFLAIVIFWPEVSDLEN